MGERAHFLADFRSQLPLAVEVPKRQPMVEELRLDADPKVSAGKAASIIRWAACLKGPEVGNLGEVDVPIRNVRVEYRPEDYVLPDVHVERADEVQDAFVAAKLGVERFGFGSRIHALCFPTMADGVRRRFLIR